MKVKKSLGQHFLRSEKALREIVNSGDIKNTDTILEIGPGEGVLTAKLLTLANKVIAVEKDTDLISGLNERFKKEIKSKKLILLNQDALLFDPKIYFGNKKYKLIANIPYYITGAIIEKYLSNFSQPELAVLLMQKEVAERIVAKNKKGSILSIAVKVYGDPQIISKVPRGAFVPPPSVESAVLLIKNISRDFFNKKEICDEKLFFEILKTTFGKKRNQMSRSFGEYLKNKEIALEILNTISIDSKTRPEDMSLSDWKRLTQALSTKMLYNIVNEKK